MEKRNLCWFSLQRLRCSLALMFIVGLSCGASSAFAEECSAAFLNGLQSHSENGEIQFQFNAKLYNAPSNQLDTATLRLHPSSANVSCGATSCIASGTPSKKITSTPFIQTVSTKSLTVPSMLIKTIGDSQDVEYQTIVVSDGATLIFSAQTNPYLIKNLRVNYRSVLQLPAGDYWVETLFLGSQSKIEVLGAGTVRLFVKDALTVYSGVKINDNTKNASQLFLYSYSDVSFNASAGNAYALIYAQGNVVISSASRVMGGVAASNVTLMDNSYVSYQADAATSANFGASCLGDITADLEPPLLTFNPLPLRTEKNNIVISGMVSDPVQVNSGVASVIVKLSSGAQVVAAINGGSYSATVPLELGDNLLVVEARDYAGNLTALDQTVFRAELTNQCLTAFSNGLQSHGVNGEIQFQFNAKLYNGSSNQLEATTVKLHPSSANVSCGSTSCIASGVASKKIIPTPFIQTVSTKSLTVPAMLTKTIGDSQDVEYQKIVVSDEATLIFSAQTNPYLIKNLRVNYRSVLQLPAGDYWVETLFLGSQSKIEVLGAGTVRLFVKDPLTVYSGVKINDNTKNASQLFLYSYSDVSFNASAGNAYALIYAQGNIVISSASRVMGGVAASNITLMDNSYVSYQANAVTSANFGAMCTGNNGANDQDPPLLTLNPVPLQVEGSNIVISGMVSDPLQANSGIASVVVKLSSGVQVIATVNGGSYSAAVPLALGSNLLVVEARDYSGNSTSLNAAINRISLPRLQVISPIDGHQSLLPSIGVNGILHTDWPLTNVQFFINNIQYPVAEVQAGVYQFSVEGLALQLGENTFNVRAVTPDGIQEKIIKIKYVQADRDGDGHLDETDVFPDDANEWSDLDSDGVGDNADIDRDGDGISNDYETQAGTDPNDSNSKPLDADADGIPDVLDDDLDNDGHPNAQDKFPNDPAEWSDLDNDGIGDNADTDRDGDGISNDYETQLGTDPNDTGSVPDDGDTDGIPDLLDDDRDDDGHVNAQDKFPDDATEWADLDNDGMGDNADTDRDGDGFSNDLEQQKNTDPADINDYPDTVAPLLQLINPANETTESSVLILLGTASDPLQPYSGIAGVSVVNDRFSNTVISATINGSEYQAEIPLVFGNNMLVITALDSSGNSTEITHNVQRIDSLAIRNLSPANGSVITANKVSIIGQIITSLPLDSVRFYINEWQVTPSGTAVANTYSFDLPDIALQLGQNTFVLRAETPQGIEQSTLMLTHNPENSSAIKAPEISLISPNSGSQLRDSTFLLKGRVLSYAGAVNVFVNGQSTVVKSSDSDTYYFEYLASFAADQSVLELMIEAVDALSKRTQLRTSYSLDNTRPQISLVGREASPAINTISESPFVVSGTVSDSNLASITVNDEPIRVKPGAVIGSYDFALPMQLAPGAQTQLSFDAYDLSGNRTRVEYVFQSNAQATISTLLPGEDANFVSTGEPLKTQIAARVTDAPEGSSVVAIMNDISTPLILTGTLATGELTLPATTGSYVLNYQVLNVGQIIASTSLTFHVTNEENVPVSLVSYKPENGSTNVEPNQPIELFFNKSIDPTKLSIKVRETLHGKTYLNLDQPGLDFLNAQGDQLKDVYRDNELVMGATSLLPGGKALAFYANRQYGFNANLTAEIIYDGNELARFTFKVRQLPTFIIGGVSDQFGQPLSGIEVSLPDLNRTTITNQDGGFAFGFQEQPGNEIPGGRHKLIINPDLASPRYGVQVRTINLQEGYKNEIGMSKLPELHPESPFQLISSGQANTSFAGDELRLDLSSARLLFNKGRSSGSVQYQFMPFEQINAPMTPGASPQWIFAGQPRGVKVEGSIGIDIKMPKLNGSYDYVPMDIKYVVLLAYDAEKEVIEPIGIGLIDNYHVRSIGKVGVNTLDYFGYAWISHEHQPLLKEVADGTKSIQQLVSALQQ